MSDETWPKKTEQEMEADLIRQLGWSSEKVKEARVHARQLGYISLCGFMQDILAGKSRALESQTPRRPISANHVPRTSAPNSAASLPIVPLDEALRELTEMYGRLSPLPDGYFVKAYITRNIRQLVLIDADGHIGIFPRDSEHKWHTKVDLTTLR